MDFGLTLTVAVALLCAAGCGSGRSDTAACRDAATAYRQVTGAFHAISSRTATVKDELPAVKAGVQGLEAAVNKANSGSLRSDLRKVADDFARVRVDLINGIDPQIETDRLNTDLTFLNRECPSGVG